MMATSFYFVIFSAVAFEVLGQLCLKRAALSHPPTRRDSGPRAFLADIARSGWTYAGVAAYLVELFLWVAVLHFAPLSQAFPLMSLTYCGVAVASRFFLRERISIRGATGIALVTLGAICVLAATA